MAAAAILDFVMEFQEIRTVITVILFLEMYYDFKFDENPFIGSEVTAGFRKVDFGV
jgi:hypothetical protein